MIPDGRLPDEDNKASAKPDGTATSWSSVCEGGEAGGGGGEEGGLGLLAGGSRL